MTNDEIDNLIDRVKHLKILYVEDNPEVKKQTLKILDELFEDISTAENGLEGLNIFKNNNIDLIFTDINMPIMDGIDMIKHIRDIKNEVPVIVFTAHNEKNIVSNITKYKLLKCIFKPIDIDELFEILDFCYN